MGSGMTAAGCGGAVLHPDSSAFTKISNSAATAERDVRRMIESGFWIFLVEAAVAGTLFAGLIWWVVRGTGDRDRKLREADEQLRKASEAAPTRKPPG
jgi:hypothetical protein